MFALCMDAEDTCGGRRSCGVPISSKWERYLYSLPTGYHILKAEQRERHCSEASCGMRVCQ